MFDKTFFKFAIIFGAIIALSLGSLYISGLLQTKGGSFEAATGKR